MPYCVSKPLAIAALLTAALCPLAKSQSADDAAAAAAQAAATARIQARMARMSPQAAAAMQSNLANAGISTFMPPGPKKPGMTRIGLILPANQLGGNGDPNAGEAVRDAELKLLTGPALESVKLQAVMPDQAAAEARTYNCDYILAATLTQQKVEPTGRFGKLMNMRNMQMASSAAMLIPGVGSTAMMASMLSGQLMQQELTSATKGVKSNSDVTLQYTLTAANGQVALNDVAKVRSKSDGENVLTPLLTEAAGKVITTVKPGGAETAGAVAPPPNPGTVSPAPETAAGPSSIRAYAAYDFVPGEKQLFVDDFTTTQDGEFPAGWELLKGQGAVNQQAGSTAFVLTDGSFAKMRPRLNMASLGKEWTLEFDMYGITDGGKPAVFFNLDKNSDNPNLTFESFRAVYFYSHGDDGVNLESHYPDDIANRNYVGRWHHVAIAYRAPQMKVYVDQYRVIYVPDMKFTPQAVTLGGDARPTAPIVLRNVRIASGAGMNLVATRFTENKIVTHGINFDTDKATIKPESMGTLNQIKKLLDADPALKFEVDGHTDNTGAAAHNLQLSGERANAVKAELVAMGVDPSRLTAKGLGDTKPLGPNTTAEGKANNRRVEFVRM